MYSPVFLEYEIGYRAQELRRPLDRALWAADLSKMRAERCRSRLARKLVTLGLRLDPQAASAALHVHPLAR